MLGKKEPFHLVETGMSSIEMEVVVVVREGENLFLEA